MGAIYQLTFFLAVALLAIVITIFVFAVSLVGRAIESASREQQVLLSSQTEAKKKQIKRLQEQLKDAEKTGNLDKGQLNEELTQTQHEIDGYQAQLDHIEKRQSLIRRRGAVVCPGIALFITLALTMIASGLAEAQNPPDFTLWLWIVSLGFLVFGIYRLFITLGAIEEVTITSQEAIEKLPEAVKAALKEIEEEKKPVLGLVFLGEQPPFRIKAGTERQIEFAVVLKKGSEARNVVVYFTAPPGFSFPGMKVTVQSNLSEFPTYIMTGTTMIDIRKGINKENGITIKAPDISKEYMLFARIVCTDFDSESIPIKVVVE